MGTDARDLPCAWKTGSGGTVLLATSANYSQAGLQGSREQEGCLGRTKDVNYYLLDTHSVRNLLSTVDTLDQAKGM